MTYIWGSPPHLPCSRKEVENPLKKYTYDYSYTEAVERMEIKIIQITSAYGSSGISHTQLANLAGIDRKNLSTYTKRLIVRGLLRRGPGKQGNYYLAFRYNTGPIITPDTYGRTVADELLTEDFDINSASITKEATNLAEYTLLSFSNKLGAVLTYLLIQSICEFDKIVTNPKSNIRRDLKAKKWIGDAILSFVPLLLPTLKKLVMPCLPDPSIPKSNILEILHRPRALRESMVSELQDLLSNSYSSIRPKLEQIKLQLPKEADRIVAHWQYSVEISKQQRICKHKFRPPTNWALVRRIMDDCLVEGNSNHEILHCRKCHFTKYEKCKLCPLLDDLIERYRRT